MNKYIISNCDNCYYYDDDNSYWCEFERDNTHFANPCQNSSCLLKQVVDKIKEAGCKSDELYYTEFKQYFDEDFLPAVNELLDIREILNERNK